MGCWTLAFSSRHSRDSHNSPTCPQTTESVVPIQVDAARNSWHASTQYSIIPQFQVQDFGEGLGILAGDNRRGRDQAAYIAAVGDPISKTRERIYSISTNYRRRYFIGMLNPRLFVDTRGFSLFGDGVRRH